MTTTARISARRAKQLVEAAELVKAPDWRETNSWHVVADGETLVVVEPAYRAGTRRGWSQHLAALGPSGSALHFSTREQAAVAGLGAWQRWATAPR